jgi:hypothetical protein
MSTPAIQPTLDGTVPTPKPTAARQRMDDYETWIDTCRPAFEAAAASGMPFTTSQIQERYNLPDPPNPARNWGHLALRFQSEHLMREWSTDRSKRPTVHRSRVTQWIGIPADERGGEAA